MKKALIFLLTTLIMISLVGCRGAESDSHKDTTEESVTEDVTEELTPETSKPAETETEKVTEKVTEKETEKTTQKVVEDIVERVTEAVTPPTVAPITQSYLEVYDLPESDVGNITKYTVCDSQYAVTVVFEAKGSIANLKICALEMTEGYDEITDTVLENISLNDGEKIAVMLDFPGDMSSWYYSYTNNVGKTYEKQIYISGMDGSLVSADWIY